jgi:hypothetical protein
MYKGAGEVEVLRAQGDDLAQAQARVASEKHHCEAGRPNLHCGSDERLEVVGLEMLDLTGVSGRTERGG